MSWRVAGARVGAQSVAMQQVQFVSEVDRILGLKHYSWWSRAKVSSEQVEQSGRHVQSSINVQSLWPYVVVV